MDKLQLVWSGETELPAGWKLQAHTHDYFHMAYVSKGNLIFRAGGTDYPLSEGSIILIPPFVVHEVPMDNHRLCTQYEVFFRILDPDMDCLFNTQNVIVQHGASHLENLFAYIGLNYNSTDFLRASSVNSFLSAILFSLLLCNTAPESVSNGFVDYSRYSPLVQKILYYVEKNCEGKFDLSNLAQKLGFNKNYLCTVFRRETGITISEYNNYHRIRRVLISLQYHGFNKEVPIHDLAEQFGYMNPSYFNRVFKKYTGMTPIEFINSLSKGSDNPDQSIFQKYYIEYLDQKRYPINESLQYMRGLKTVSELDEFPEKDSAT